MTTIPSPFSEAFVRFAESIRAECLICSPYVTMGAIQRFLGILRAKTSTEHIAVRMLTSISAPSLMAGATDIDALLLLLEGVPRSEVVYVPRVHAKVYVSDDSLAIVGSANLTEGGLTENLEYALATRDQTVVRRIRRDLEQYASLGALVPRSALQDLRARVSAAREAVDAEQRSIAREVRRLSRSLFEGTEDELVRLRLRGRTVHAIFADTIRYLLRRGPMPTRLMHQHIQQLHPDLCDESKDRVIDGQRFGKLWKHHMRNAQVYLRRGGVIGYDRARRVWFLRQQLRQRRSFPSRNAGSELPTSEGSPRH